MSSAELAVSVRGLSKSYTIAQDNEKHRTLAEALLSRVKNPLRRPSTESFWALKDVDLDVRKGEVLGVIGRNGAGKSTLFKLLSRITGPTAGEIRLYGRVGSLLEVGTGFSAELTGRENIYLNGTILGMKRHEIDRRFDEIVDFADVTKFLDTPVKRYSSGMYVRLAFAVAAHLDPEILIVDEVLSVGDADFQKKCLGRIAEVARGGRTVLFVSHNLHSVKQLCTRAILLRKGRLIYDGDPTSTAAQYSKLTASMERTDDEPDRRPGSGEYRFTSVRSAKSCFNIDEEKLLIFNLACRRGSVTRMYVSAHIVNSEGRTIYQCDSRLTGFILEDGKEMTCRLRLRNAWLKPDRYHVDCFICAMGIVDECRQACYFEVSSSLPYPATASEESIIAGAVLVDFHWE